MAFGLLQRWPNCYEALVQKSLGLHLLLFLFGGIFGSLDLFAEVSQDGRNFRVLNLYTEPTREGAPPPGSQVGVQIYFNEGDPAVRDRIDLIHVPISRSISVMARQTLEAIETQRPDVIVGGATSNQAFVISDLAEKKGIPYISTSATHPALTKGKERTFRVCFDDHYQAARMAEFILRDRGLRRGFIIYDRSETFSVGVEASFRKHFQSIGGEILKSISFERERELGEKEIADLSENLSQAQFVLLPNYQVATAALISKMLSSFPSHLVYVGPDSWNASPLIQAVIDSHLGPVEAYFVEHWSAEHQVKENERFKSIMMSRNISSESRELLTKIDSGSSFALGFDAMGVIFRAIAEYLKGDEPIGEQDLTGFIRGVRFEGATGLIDFSQGPTPEKPLFIYRFSSGEKEFVKAYR